MVYSGNIDNNVTQKAFNAMAKNYNTLDYSPRLIDLLKSVYPTETFTGYTKYALHQLLNDTLLDNYKGEEVLKYKLFKRYSSVKNIVAAFEIKVNNSRADFLTINGHTKSYEIKSELDNFSKFQKQAADYIMAFEYNYLVTDEKHIEKAKDLIPDVFGLWSYKNGEYKPVKKAILNDKMNPEVQLRLLTKKERITGFPEIEAGMTEKILAHYEAPIINQQFKQLLKDRYRIRWDFVKTNKTQILPIDVQFFFNANILPEHIYYH